MKRIGLRLFSGYDNLSAKPHRCGPSLVKRLLPFSGETFILLPSKKSFELPLEIVREFVRTPMSRQVRHLYEFGPFRLDPEKPCLWRDGEPVALTPKAVETLLVLVQQNGRLVEREHLMSAIWPDTFVEDGNLNFNVSMLRKALGTDEAGEQYIQTVPRHGYRFNAKVREVAEEVPARIVEKQTQARVGIEESEFPTEDDLAVQKAALGLATAYYKTGQLARATETRNRLKKLAEKDPKSLFFLALHDTEIGRTDEAVAALRKCIDLREERVVTTKDEPRFSALKDDPRFKELLQVLNLAG